MDPLIAPQAIATGSAHVGCYCGLRRASPGSDHWPALHDSQWPDPQAEILQRLPRLPTDHCRLATGDLQIGRLGGRLPSPQPRDRPYLPRTGAYRAVGLRSRKDHRRLQGSWASRPPVRGTGHEFQSDAVRRTRRRTDTTRMASTTAGLPDGKGTGLHAGGGKAMEDVRPDGQDPPAPTSERRLACRSWQRSQGSISDLRIESGPTWLSAHALAHVSALIQHLTKELFLSKPVEPLLLNAAGE